jgi:hypothetical protein
MLPIILGAALIVATLILGVEGFRRRRPGVSWADIALLGPMVWLNLDRYIQDRYHQRFVKLVLVWVGLFIALGIAVAVSEWR